MTAKRSVLDSSLAGVLVLTTTFTVCTELAGSGTWIYGICGEMAKVYIY